MKHALVFSLMAVLGMSRACSEPSADHSARPAAEVSGILGPVAWVPGVPTYGMAIAQEGDILIYGGGTELVTLDVSRPERPRILGRVGGLGNVRQVAVQDGWAYVASRETGLWIVDVRRPASPRVTARFDCLELATGVDVAGDIVFLGQRSYGVEFIDVSDKARPRHVTFVKTPESQSVKYVDGILYSGDWNAGNVTVLAARDPAEARILSVARLAGYGDGLDVCGDYLYASTGHNRKDRATGRTVAPDRNDGEGHGMEIWRREDGGRTLRFVSRVEFPTFYRLGQDMWTVRCDNATAFCADTYNGLFAVDVSDKAAPKVVGRLCTGNPVTSVAVGEGVVYVSETVRGLGLVQCTRAHRTPWAGRAAKPRNVGWRRAYPMTRDSRFDVWRPRDVGQVRGVAASGGNLYVACGEAGLYELDAATRSVKGFRPGFCGDVRVEAGRLYAAQGQDGLAVYDVGGRASGALGREVARTRLQRDNVSLALWCWAPAGDKVAVSDRAKGLVFLDKETLAWVNRVPGGPGWNRYVAAPSGGRGLLAWFQANTGVAWYDLSATPVRQFAKSPTLCPNSTSGVCAWRDGKILFTHKGFFKVFSEGAVEPEAQIPIPGRRVGEPVWDGRETVAVAERFARRVTLFRVGDGMAERLWDEELSGNPESPIFVDGRLYLPCGYQGLLMQK